MSWSKRHRGREHRGYHHGNLRDALVDAALKLIADKGPAGFTFAEAARSAGVSPAAPYRHYRDRDELLGEIARRGFERFAADLEKAWGEGEPDPMTAYHRLGRAYLAFARDEPAFYAAMFESGLAPDADPDLSRAGDEAFTVLQTATERVCALLPKEGRPPAKMVALHVWAMSHGIAAPVRTRRCGSPQPAHAAGRPAGSGYPGLSARSRVRRIARKNRAFPPYK